MICKKCGNQLNDNALFCPKCGQKIEKQMRDVSGNTRSDTYNVNSARTVSSEAPPKEKHTVRTVILSFVGTIVVVFWGLVWLGSRASDRVETVSPAASATTPSTHTGMRELRVGDQIEFGVYEQDNNTGNGAEPVLWDVIGQDNTRYLLISHYVLDYMPFEKDDSTIVRLANGEMGWDITWESSSIRQWLNSDFVDAVFDSEEKSHIVKVTNENIDFVQSMGQEERYRSLTGGFGGNDTEDSVFLLSTEDFIQYFKPGYYDEGWYIYLDAGAISSPTPYARGQGAPTKDLSRSDCMQDQNFYKKYYEGKISSDFSDKCTSWMLRSVGTAEDQSNWMQISNIGTLEAAQDCFNGGGVRPAVWVTGIEVEATEADLESADKVQGLYTRLIGSWKVEVIIRRPMVDGKDYLPFRDVRIDADFIEATDHDKCLIIHSADDFTYHEEEGTEYLYFEDMVGYLTGDGGDGKEMTEMRIYYNPAEEIMTWERKNRDGDWIEIGSYRRE